ncbi:MAG TPA: DUF433 domain-containing protein [Longimicrobium sp.]|nr:DUF433 domain-containing protein [Longimicrobium sp.]
MTNTTLGQVTHSDPEIMGGEPVFIGTRVPVQALIDYTVAGYTLDEFLAHFPTVEREQAVTFLQQTTQDLRHRAA